MLGLHFLGQLGNGSDLGNVTVDLLRCGTIGYHDSFTGGIIVVSGLGCRIACSSVAGANVFKVM